MNNFGRRPSLRERIARFMAYRYGIDRLYYVLIVICFALTFINLFLRSYIISSIETILFVFAIYRVFSKNIYKRQRENEWLNKVIDKFKKFINLQKCKYRDRKTHVYRKCPSCRNNLRLPRSKGKHTVSCPCCKHKFDVRI